MLDVAIIGGGLSGLYLASQLEKLGVDYSLFEARPRFGGRILSSSPKNILQLASQDLGPTWIWPNTQPLIAKLIEHYHISIFPHWTHGKSLYQADPDQQPYPYIDHTTYGDAYRVLGGTYTLIHTLLNDLDKNKLHLNHALSNIINQGEYVTLHLNSDNQRTEVKAKQVVLCLPPRVIHKHITFTPELDPAITHTLQETPTWMAGHAKAIIRYEKPFWRENGHSGNALANHPYATLAEVFDSSNEDGSAPSLGGFFALPPQQRQSQQHNLESRIIEQLTSLFGLDALNTIDIEIHDWFNEPFTATLEDQIPLSFHPQYGHPWLQLDHWFDKLYFCGTETAPQFGGYLEGALESAERVARAIEIGRKPNQSSVSMNCA